MQEATESSPSYEFFDNPSARRSKKLGEAEACRVVEEICRESGPQIDLAIVAAAEKLGSFQSINALDDAMTYAQNDIVDINPRKVSPEDIKKMARRALQVGFARSFPGSAIIQFPGMRAAPGAWKPKPWIWQEPETIARTRLPLWRPLLAWRGRCDSRAGWRWKKPSLDRGSASDDHRQAAFRRRDSRRP